MHCSSSAEPAPSLSPGQAASVVTLAGMLLWTAVALAESAGFVVEEADTHLVGGVHRLSAHIALRFSPEAIEAMENGVAMTVAVQSEVLEVRRLWDPAVATVDARYRIQLHALSGQYRVKNLSTGEVTSYRTLDDATRALGNVRDIPLLDDHLLDDDEQYRVRVRATLEIESLPTPLRLVAYFKSAWRLSSDWVTWPLQR